MPPPLIVALLLLQLGAPPAPVEALLEGARTGNVPQITAALNAGASVDAKGRYDVTPLISAATNGHIEVVRLLIARGANVNAQDSFYRARAIDMALSNGHTAVATLLLQNGSGGADTALAVGVQAGDADLVQQALKSPLDRSTLQAALVASVTARSTPDIGAAIRTALAALPPEAAAPAVSVDGATLDRYVGQYRDAGTGINITVARAADALTLQVQGQPAVPLVARSPTTFGSPVVPNLAATFNGASGPASSLTIVQGPANITLARVETTAPPTAPAATAGPPVNGPTAAPPLAAAAPSAATPARVTVARNWPSFRGIDAAGNGDGQGAVTEWDVSSGKNIKWKTVIPGMANASPIVWGDRVFVTTAVSAANSTIRTGAYGDVKPADDVSEHQWKMYCLDRTTGKVLWERTASKGAPRTKRHTKASQANSTPVTDGQRVVSAFAPAGLLVAWDFTGKELWRVDLGTVDSGWFFDATFQWGHASSPVIFRDNVILQVDMQKGSYLGAWNLRTGKPVWKTPRPDEISTWGTPTLVPAEGGRFELVTNGTKVRGYDPATGALLWTLGPNSEITVATPVAGHGLVFVTGGYPPVRPIYAIRPGAKGDISLASGQSTNAAIAWSNTTDGTYIPTPIVYGDFLYTLNNNGVVSAYDAKTGTLAFRGRVGMGGSFSASLVAADGHLYVSSEEGEIHVVSAAPGLAPLARNDMQEVVMATPAISGGVIFVRTIGHVYAIGQ